MVLCEEMGFDNNEGLHTTSMKLSTDIANGRKIWRGNELYRRYGKWSGVA